MFFFYVILIVLAILTILIIFTTIQIHVENVKFRIPKNGETHINTKYKITIKFYILKKINYLKLDITKDKIEKAFMNKNINKMMEKNKKNIDIKQISNLEKMNFKLKQMNLKIYLGLEDAALNAIMVGIISSSISIIMGILIDKNILKFENKKVEKNEIYWKIVPIYQNKNLLNIDLDCIISFKLIHIIYIVINWVRVNRKIPKRELSPTYKREERKKKCQNIQ